MRVACVLLTTLLLTGCLATPVKQSFPDSIKEIMVECPELKEIPPGTTKLSEAVLVITENYGQYHTCRAKVQAWIEWYNDQKKIFNQVK